MEKKPEKYEKSLDMAKQSLKSADHLTYTTYRVVKENKLLLKILEEIYRATKLAINSILQYEYLHKRIEIYENPKENFKNFEKLSKKYKINKKQMEKISKILKMGKKHKKSPFEFGKNNKIVIMEGRDVESLDINELKKYLIEAKDLIRKIENKIR